MRRWTRRRRETLSVVVPVYNVADYLAACLDSILRQPVAHLDVVVVDDGSTDGSADVARAYAARHACISVMEQPNQGVSTARNRAVERCTGEFLTFVDPDDVLPRDAWSTMLATLVDTGSDFVVGKAERLQDGRRSVTPLMERNHRERRLRVTIDEVPLMLADVFVWNKVFRRSFWDEAAIWFPERTRYQDQPALTQAFLAARSFDVLPDVVYDWRMREDLSSATQKRADLSNLRERVGTKALTVEMVERHGDPELLRVLLTEILPIDMWEHFRASLRAGEEYWTELVAGTRRFWDDAGWPFEATALPAPQRLMGWLTVRDRQDDLRRWVDLLDAEGPRFEDDVLVHPWSDEVEVRRAPASSPT